MTKVCASNHWLRRAMLLAFAISLICSLGAAGSASAATTSPARSNATPAAVKLGNFTVPYKDSWTFKSKNIGICVIFTATGKFTYSVSRGPGSKFGFKYTWAGQRLSNPTVEANVHAYAKGSCIGPATTTAMQLGEAWTGFSCSFNPSLGFSIPWGVSVGFWPSCGNRR